MYFYIQIPKLLILKRFVNSYFALGFMLLYLFLGSNSCGVKKTKTPHDWIQLQQTPCFGTCPVYVLKIQSDGSMILKGTNFLDKIGNYSLKLQKQDLDTLQELVSKVDFNSLDDSYDPGISDFPSSIFTIHTTEMNRTIAVVADAPEELMKLLKYIDSLRKKDGWKKEDETEE